MHTWVLWSLCKLWCFKKKSSSKNELFQLHMVFFKTHFSLIVQPMFHHSRSMSNMEAERIISNWALQETTTFAFRNTKRPRNGKTSVMAAMGAAYSSFTASSQATHLKFNSQNPWKVTKTRKLSPNHHGFQGLCCMLLNFKGIHSIESYRIINNLESIQRTNQHFTLLTINIETCIEANIFQLRTSFFPKLPLNKSLASRHFVRWPFLSFEAFFQRPNEISDVHQQRSLGRFVLTLEIQGV